MSHMWVGGSFVVRNKTLVAIMLGLVVAFLMALPLLTPQQPPQPINSYFDYKPNPVYSSTYRVSYQIQNPVNVSQDVPLSLLFNVSCLVGQTSEVDVHSLNVTITTSDGRVLFTQVINDERILKQGELWGPKTMNILIDNSTAMLAPGASMNAYVSISVAFDEVMVTNLLVTTQVQHYPKLAVSPQNSIVLTIQNPSTITVSNAVVDLPQLAVTGFLVGALAYMFLQMGSFFVSLPRPDSRLPSGFRDPSTGRAIGRWASYQVFISLMLGLMFLAMAQLGTQEYQINLLKFVSDVFLGRFDFELTATVLLWAGGFMLGRRH